MSLLAAARWVGVDHVGYFSIVGLDRTPIPDNATMLRTEQARAAPGVCYPILGAARVGDLIAAILAVRRFSPVLRALRCVTIPPVYAGEAAERCVGLTDAEAAERVPDICGLGVRTHTDLGHAYVSAHAAAGQWRIFRCRAESPRATATGHSVHRTARWA